MQSSSERQRDVVSIHLVQDGVHISQVLTPAFLQKYTNFYNFKELTFSSLVWIDWNQPVVLTRRSLLDEFIAGSSQFSSWEQMYQKAWEEYSAG